MSSGDSRTTSSSRLSQFGIYRSIDARTEEFLRLSRKRQIRQGCACAAVSTAITVTIVIAVLLVYEYTMSLDANPKLKSRMAAWHGIFNDTSPFEAKYAKPKVNVDPTTLKLIPLVIKALNQNRNIDNTTPASNKREDVTEQGFRNNLFHGTKAKQTQNMYTRDFKSSPAFAYRNTLNKFDIFKKNRQTNDYNRMLNYFDKMKNVNALDTSVFSSEETTEETSTEHSTQTSAVSDKQKHTKRLNKINQPHNGLNKTSKLLKYTTRQPTKPANQRSKSTHFTRSKTAFNFDKLPRRKYENKSHNRKERLSLKDIVLPFEKTTVKTTKHCNCSKKLADVLFRLFTDIQSILPELELYKTTCGLDNNIPQTISVKTALPTNAATTKVPVKIPSFNVQHSKEHSILSQTIKKNSWSPRDFDLESNFTNSKTNTGEFQITTIRATAESTYTTPVLEGFNTEPISKYKNKTIRRPATTTTNIPSKNELDNYLYFSNSENPLHKVGDIHSSQGSKSLNFETISEEKSQLKEKENTTSIIEWINSIKTNNKQVNIFHPKRTNNSSQCQSETTIKPTNTSSQHKSGTTLKPKERLTVSAKKSKFQIERNFNLLNGTVHKNYSLKRKRIHTIWPEENNKTEYIVTPRISKILKTINTSISLPINVINLTSNFSSNENNKEIIQFTNFTQQKRMKEMPFELKPIASNKIINTNETKTFALNATAKNATNSQTSASQSFFSKYAVINNLLYQTKNISNVTIYEKFNLGQFADDRNGWTAVEYDEFKFLNDEILESERSEGKHPEPDKYSIFKSEKQQKDDSDEPKFIKSMIPSSKPVFLEIQRSDWKHDDIAELDYGTSENNFE